MATPPSGPPPQMSRGTGAGVSSNGMPPPAGSLPNPQPPPSSGGRRSGGRKPARSRYVDVLNQSGNL